MKSVTIPVPLALCRMLLTKSEDLKNPDLWPDLHDSSLGMLQMLVDAHTPTPIEPVVRRTRRRRGLPQESAALKDPSISG